MTENAHQRKVSIKTIAHLVHKHTVLKAKVKEFEERVYLTTEEQMQLNLLKKKKLEAKDALQQQSL